MLPKDSLDFLNNKKYTMSNVTAKDITDYSNYNGIKYTVYKFFIRQDGIVKKVKLLYMDNVRLAFNYKNINHIKSDWYRRGEAVHNIKVQNFVGDGDKMSVSAIRKKIESGVIGTFS